MCKNIYINNHTTITNYIHGDTRETFIYLHDLPSRMLDPLSGYLQKFTVDTLYKFSIIIEVVKVPVLVAMFMGGLTANEKYLIKQLSL